MILAKMRMYRISLKTKPSLKIRPRSNLKNDFNTSLAPEVRPIQ